MAWSRTRDPFAEQNIQSTNILVAPTGKGVPVSSKELNISFLLRSQAEQEIMRALAPSGYITRLSAVSTLETTTQQDVDGEIVALKTNGTPIANQFRVGRTQIVVNGWKLTHSNVDGTNGLHCNQTLDTAPSTGGRVDLVFLEVWLAELGGTSASISNTANKPSATTLYKYGNTMYRGTNVTDDISETDAEINRRWQIQYRSRVVNGVDIDTYPDGIDHSSVVKAWGANPNATWSGATSGTGSPYTFTRSATDPGMYVAGDGSTTAKSVLGTVDGYVYAIPVAAVFRRNTGVYDPATNPLGCAASGPTGGLIASGISGRPDGFFADQIAESDILNLRHQVVFDGIASYEHYQSDCFDKLIRGNLTSNFGRGDAAGSPAASRSTYTLYAQEISTVGALDAGFKGFAEYNYQRRIFSDAAVTQQTAFTFTGGATPDGQVPSTLSAPASPSGSNSTSSGTLAAATYGFKITYTNAFGESLPSAEGTTTLASTGQITVNSPVASGTGTAAVATGWNVYITATAGSNWKKQNGSPIAIGTNYTQSSALAAVTNPPAANTSSSTLVITASNTGITYGTATVKCVDGSTTPGAGSLQNSQNIVVYNALNNTVIAGSWANLGTSTATFTPTSPWVSNDTTYGVVALVGISYPAGNGMTFRAENVVAQSLVQGGSTYNMAQIGVTGVAAADDAHLNTPYNVTVDSSGNIFVCDTNNHRVVKYNSSFVKQAQFGVTGVSAADNTHLNSPKGICVDGSGNIYVADTNNHRIVKLSSSLAYAAQFGTTGSSGSTTSTLNQPTCVILDNAGTNLFIADSVNKRVVRITTAMAYGATPVSSLTYNVLGVAADWDGTYNQLWVTQQHSVQKYTTSNGSTWAFSFGFGSASTVGSTIYRLNNPQAVIVTTPANLNTGLAGLGNIHDILIADSGNNRIVQVNASGNYIGQFGVSAKAGTDLGHLNGVAGVAVDTTGLLYIADASNHRIVKLHKQMGACDFPLRQFEVLYAGASTDRLKVWYNYRPYQGVIASQGSTLMNYSFRAVSDMQAVITTCGTAGRNAQTEDNLNGFITRLPLPYAGFGGNPSVNETEYKYDGTGLIMTGTDTAGIITAGNIAWGGAMTTYGPADPMGNQANHLLAGSLVKISQAGGVTGYPFRGVNTVQRYVPNLGVNSGYDNLGFSVGQVNAIEHLTVGYFLAVASGGSSTLPIIPGEVVMIVVTFRHNGTSAALYGQTNVATAVDVFRLPTRPLVRY